MSGRRLLSSRSDIQVLHWHSSALQFLVLRRSHSGTLLPAMLLVQSGSFESLRAPKWASVGMIRPECNSTPLRGPFVDARSKGPGSAPVCTRSTNPNSLQLAPVTDRKSVVKGKSVDLGG